MKHRSLARLNKIFGDTLGTLPSGEPKFRWTRARDLVFYSKIAVRKRGDFWLPVEELHYIEQRWSDIYGDVWIVAHWAPPRCSALQWEADFKGTFPYPAKGSYHPVDGTEIEIEPTEEQTRAIAHAILVQSSQSEAKILAGLKERAAARKRETISRFEDDMDDCMPAFSNLRGKKLPVSFPSTNQPKEEKS